MKIDAAQSKYVAITILILPLLVLPFAGLAQTTSDAQKLPPAIPRSLQNATATVEHPPVTVDVGIKRRFDDSPKALSKHEMKAANAINKTRLQIFARHVAMTEPIERIDIGDDTITVAINGPGKLFGIIPKSITYKTTVTFSDEVDDIKTRIESGWVRYLTTERKPDVISEEIAKQVAAANYLSVTQLRAVITEAIVGTVKTR
jgi:hypothetical protein